LIVYNSVTAADQHERLGFPAEKRVVIPNGFNLNRFRPDLSSRIELREKLGIQEDQLLLGLIGRTHPMKNHLGWLQAFREIRAKHGTVHCVIVGTGVAEENGSIQSAVHSAGLERAVTLLPPTTMPEKLYPALDLLVMPSLWGEGFPNVVGEAMACAVPALVTDVGDSAAVVGDTGFVALDGSPAELTRRTLDALQLGPEGLASYGRRACKRIKDRYALESINSRYREVLQSAADYRC
jgi:glycosyltransferase involved in cell wall biosynthesis